MKLLYIVATFSSLAIAFPSSTTTKNAKVSLADAANCEPGRKYCYEQIVKDLGT